MSEPAPRTRTPSPDLDRRLFALLDEVGATANRDQLFEILVSAVGLASDDVDRLDLKITNAALKEMRAAFALFARYRDVPKVTIFGSARTLPDDPLYGQTRDLARALAAQGWMVVTGAGPGIMAAGMEGAGLERAIGINIRLPFEQEPNPFIADDKLLSMKYFFTRKLMLMKESAGFAVLPGGFGTLDEALELLTLQQTGKADPHPIVLLDEVEHGTYWHAWERFFVDEVVSRGYVNHDDDCLYRITDDVAAAVGEILGFYRNYHSIRFVRDRLVIRLRVLPTDDDLTALNEEFVDICAGGRIEAAAPLPAEVADEDRLELPRIVLRFDRLHYARLHELIRRLNGMPSVERL